jgi:hypothetical protein
MKFANLVLFVSVIFVAGLANASLQPEGSFIATQCGVQEKAEANVEAVCVGQIVGETGRAVQFRMKDQSLRTFKVVNQTNMMVALLSGNVKTNFFLQGPNGETTTMKAVMTHQGAVNAVSGQLDGADYFAPKMETMFVIQ